MRLWTPAEFHSAVYALCLIHAASVTSGARSAARNRAKGGAETSQHLEDLAVDVVCDEPRAQPRLAADARKLGMVAIEESDHVHIQAYTRAAHERLRALLWDA